MRCRQVWPTQEALIQDDKLLAMMGFWNELQDLSLAELVFPLRWEGKIEGPVHIASILDFLIRSHEHVPATIPDATHDGDEPTPWMDCPTISDDITTAGCMQADSCTVIFEDTEDSPIRFQPKSCATVSQFLQAHAKLVEALDVEEITLNGRPISPDHVMEVGQLIIIRTRKLVSHDYGSDDPIVSPTAEWTQPVTDPIEVKSPPRKLGRVSKFDVGECTLPKKCSPDVPWLDATPMLQLQGEQFLKLSMPSVTNTQQLWSVRHHFFRSHDRLKILEAQQQFCADDEIRFHLNALVSAFRDHQLQGKSPVRPLCVIDPLLATSWVVGKGFDCSLWAKDHPEIIQKGVPIVTVVLIDHHWIPIYMNPVQCVLQVSTWDRAEAKHEGLSHVIDHLAVSLGFENALIRREHRLFFTSELCGSLAIAYLRDALVGSQLPADHNEAMMIHARLKEKYVSVLQNCDIVDRPWVWGAGDKPAASESTCGSPIDLSAVNMSRDERIDLINAKGRAMADDEIRFHLLNLIDKQPVSSTLLGRTYTFIEPLTYNCWSSIGKIIVEQWCDKNPQVSSQGVNVITAFSIEDHWFPLWISPRSTVLQVHTFQADGIDFTQVEAIVEVISNKLGFLSFAIHRIPEVLPAHDMCGAFAMCFLAHVVMGMPLPEDLFELRTLHTNMRAAFVAHLYSHDSTPRPVVWGKGKKVSTSGFGILDESEDLETNRWELAQPTEMPFTPGLVSTGNESQEGLCQRDCHDAGFAVSPKNPPNAEQRSFSSVRDASNAMSVGSHPPEAASGSGINVAPITGPNCQGESRPLPIMPGKQIAGGERLFGLSNQAMSGHGTISGFAACRTSGDTRESGPLPIMPARSSADYQTEPPEGMHAQMPISRDAESNRNGEQIDHADRQARLLQITSHSYAMADDEMQFQLQHLLQCSRDDDRAFMVVPCLGMYQWTLGEPETLEAWIAECWSSRDKEETHLLAALLVERHWIPIWFAPSHGSFHAHTLANFASDEPLVDSILHLFAARMGFSLSLIHRTPHGLAVDRLCGVMTVSFFAHILLRTVMPQTIDDLYSRCWHMKEVFAQALQSGPVSKPTAWGWGFEGECRPHPIMPVWSEVSGAIMSHMGLVGAREGVCLDVPCLQFNAPVGITSAEMAWHISDLARGCPIGLWVTVVGRSHLTFLLRAFQASPHKLCCCAFLCQFHWTPVIAFKHHGVLHVFVDEGITLHLDMPGLVMHQVYRETETDSFCGVETWAFLARIWKFAVIQGTAADIRAWLFHQCPIPFCVGSPIGYGPHGQLLKNLCLELAKHGVPEEKLEERAHSAIKALGSEQLITALNHRQPWRQLKALGNNSRFQFVLPSELTKVVDAQKGKPVAKGKGKGKSKAIPRSVDLDPTKLQVLDGAFRFQDKALPQLTMKQLGPLSCGVILITLQDAEPFLKAGKLVSQEPLALIVLHRADMPVQTSLPHAMVSVPCRCMVDCEPVLVEGVLVQIGTGLVEKALGAAMLTVETPDVATLKVMVYKDELKSDWEEFCVSPIKCLVGLLPMLRRCFTDQCQCEGWHNVEKLPIREPIIDVWRRQFLRQGFKPCPPAQAEIFSVCLRIPMCLLSASLGASGVSGAYCEPRTADGREVLADFTVIWTSRHSPQELTHIMKTNPAVIGLARLADRRGLRVRSEQAKLIHQIVKPDTVYLPSGPKTVYTVGPLPYGVDRQAVGRILQQAGWESRPLQPASPCPGKGVMWLVQSTEEPSQTIIPTTTGEIMIAKVRQDNVSQPVQPMTVGTAATLALCGKQADGKPAEGDPWATADLWRKYHPTSSVTSGPAEGLQQIEDRIQHAVLAKIQPPMEQDDMPGRVHALEDQVQHLLAKQQGLEHQFTEHSTAHTQQLNALQGQVTAQAQQFHGHLENQNQTIQSLFEQQMQQIRGLLAKRPREEGME